MGPKQAEMDDVVRRVFEYLEEQDGCDGKKSLMVLVGDHGMTEVCLFCFRPLLGLIIFCRRATTAARLTARLTLPCSSPPLRTKASRHHQHLAFSVLSSSMQW